MNLETQLTLLKEQGLSKAKAAEAVGLSREKFDIALDSMGMDWPRQRQGIYEVNGLRRTLEKHAEAVGMSPSAVRSRIQKGQDISEPSKLIPVTPEEAARFAEMRKQGIPAWQAAQAMQRPYNTLKNAAKRYVPDYEKIVASAPRIRRAPEDIEMAS